MAIRRSVQAKYDPYELLERLSFITHRIYSANKLNEVLQIAVDEARSLLGSDRVVVYQLLPQGDGVISAESVSQETSKIQGKLIYDPCFQTQWDVPYRSGKVSSIEDIEESDLKPCYVELLKTLKVRANLVVPIVQYVSNPHPIPTPSQQDNDPATTQHLWGLLIAHECHHPRQWQRLEIQTLKQIGVQVGAVVQRLQQEQRIHNLNQQLELNSKQTSAALKQVQTELCWQKALLQTMTNAAPLAFYVVDNRTDTILYFNHRFCEIWGIDHLEPLMRCGSLKNNDLIPACLPLISDIPAFAASCEPLQDESNRITIEDEIAFVDGRTIRRFSSQIRDQSDRYFGRLYIFEDITARKQAENKLRKSETDLAAAQKVAQIGNWEFDLGTKKITWSEEVFRIFGLDPNQSEPSYAGLIALHHPDDRSRLIEAVERTIAFQEPYELDLRICPPDRPVRYVEGRGKAILNRDGQVIGLFGTVQDISDRKQIEAALHTSQARFAGILEIANDAIISVDEHQRITLFNQGAEKIFGYTALEVLHHPLHKLLPEQFAQTHQQHVRHFANSNGRARRMGSDRSEVWGRRKDGTEFPAEVSISKLQNGSTTIYTAILRDITEQKQAEAALRDSEERYRSVVTAMAEGVVVKKADGQIITCNRRAEQILGLATDKINSKSSLDPSWQAIHEDGSPFPGDSHPAMVTLHTGQPQIDVVMGIYQPDQSLTWISINSQPLFQAGQTQPYAVVSSFTDITARKQTEAALKLQTERERMIYEIAQDIRRSLDLSSILNTTATEVRRFLQVERVVIYRFEPDWSGVIVTESVTEGWQSILGMSIIDSYFVETHGLQYQLGYVKATPDIYTAGFAPCHVELMEQLQVRAKLVVPIRQGETLWGLLVAHQCSAPRQWQAFEGELLTQLAIQVAIAIQQSELHQQVQKLNENLEHQVQERTAQLQQSLEFEALLKRITDSVRDSLDEEKILQQVVQELSIALKAECCDAAIYNHDRTISTILYEHRHGESNAVHWNCSIANGSDPNLYTQLFQGQYCLFCLIGPNVARPNQFLQTVLACPIADDQTVLGDLWLFKPHEEIFSDQEIRLVQQVANQCAIALRQSRLYQAAQGQVQELERLNQLKDDFLSTVSHELRSPMSSIKMATQMLEIHLRPLGLLKDNAAPITRYFQILVDECQREIQLINDLLDLTRLESGSEVLTLTPIQLHVFLPHLTEPYISRCQRQQQNLVVDVPDFLPSLVSDLFYLERIITELLHNASKYTPANETITISAHVCSQLSDFASRPDCRQPERLQIFVRNSGVEISEVERDRIFDKFYRIPNNDPWKHGGTGLGLALVKRLVEFLGGTISVSSGNNETCFTLEFPLGEEQQVHYLTLSPARL